MIEPGDTAPDFELPDQDGARVTLSSLRGRPVVSYFYPKAEALWKRQTAAKRSGQASLIARRARPERQAAVDGGTLLAPYKQEVARSSRAAPILTRAF